MQDKDLIADFPRRATEVMEIARGLFDKNDRRKLLKFIKDCEQLGAPDLSP
jgi:hypothetical protein